MVHQSSFKKQIILSNKEGYKDDQNLVCDLGADENKEEKVRKSGRPLPT